MTARVVRFLALGALGAVALVACGADGPQPLTDDQAAALSQVLVRNYDAGGAEFTATVPAGSNAQIDLEGVVDWTDHGGLAELTTTVDGEVTERLDVAWTENEVAVRPHGAADDAWTFRPADPNGVPLDRVIALLVASAGPERDNPLLVAQSDARWVGSDRIEIDGTEVGVDVFDSGGRLVFWVGADDGLLHRLDADVDGFDGTTTIAFSSHGPVELDR
jgi:hypothetical protein